MPRLAPRLFAILLATASACAPSILVRQQGEDDCVVAAVAMLLRRPYDEVYRTFRREGIAMPTWTVDAIRVAAIYGVRLEWQSRFTYDATGLLSIGWCGGGIGHMVYVERGIVHDPRGVVRPIDEYFTTRCADVVTFLAQAGGS